MKRTHLFLLMLMILAALQLAACGPKTTTIEKTSPVELKEIEGSELKQVILTEKAAQRIKVKTVPASKMVVP